MDGSYRGVVDKVSMQACRADCTWCSYKVQALSSKQSHPPKMNMPHQHPDDPKLDPPEWSEAGPITQHCSLVKSQPLS